MQTRKMYVYQYAGITTFGVVPRPTFGSFATVPAVVTIPNMQKLGACYTNPPLSLEIPGRFYLPMKASHRHELPLFFKASTIFVDVASIVISRTAQLHRCRLLTFRLDLLWLN